MTTPAILLVEDHPTTRKLVRVTLGGAGFRVLEAESGAQALSLVRERPDLVLLDLHLPDMSGFDVAERLRDAGLAAECPILAFSGFLPALEDGRVAAAGFAAFVTKPVEPSRLIEIVRLHLPVAAAADSPGRGRRVLVVEDDPIQRKLLAAKLARRGWDVREATDGEAALEMLQRAPVDVVVSDVLMPRRDGFELSLAIRTAPTLAHIPVLLVSAHAQEAGDQRLAEVVGAHALVQRQAGFEGVERALEECLRVGPRPCASASVTELRSEYLHRVIRHLERQGAFNAHLAQQSAVQAAQLDILAGTAAVMTRTLDADVLLAEMLDRTLEALGFRLGAAYMCADGRFSLRAHRGFAVGAASRNGDPLGHAALLHESSERREPLFIDADSAAAAGAAGQAWRVRSALIVTPLLSGQEVLGAYVIGCDGLNVGIEWRPFAVAIGAQLGQALATVRALGQLAVTEQRAQSTLEALSEGVVLVGRDERLQSWNASAARLFGLDNGATGARAMRHIRGRLLGEDGVPIAYEEYPTVRALRTGRSQSTVCELERPEAGQPPVWLSIRSTPLVRPGEPEPYAAVTSYADITEQRWLEEQLRQSQKLEAVGRLAGGIAHDFNNLLMVISSFSELGLASTPPGSQLADDLEEIRRAADRASALTRQLLAFSRGQEVELRVLDLNLVVRDMERMLRRLMPANIEFVGRLAAEPLLVKVDAGQLEQVLVNLVVNAGDAMPGGGTLTVTTATVDLSPLEASLAAVAPGSHVQLTVRDTGVGMSESVRARVFEPFFTTKGPDAGTGLGLATVYGIVQQSGGVITVDSVPGKGTTFRILLPTAVEPEEADPRAGAESTPALPARTILVADDQAPLRRAIVTWLRQRGHTVLEAGTGRQALDMATGHHGPIHLLITDVTMPELGGIELAERLRMTRPDTRVLFMSGYADRPAHGGCPPGRVEECMVKPFSLDTLGRRVHELLSAAAASPGAPDVG